MSRDDWNRIVPVYGLYLHRNKAFYDRIAERIRDSVHGMKVLDIGCGNGAFVRKYASSAYSVTACDYAEKMIDAAMKQQNPAGISFEIQDGAALPYEERSFDAVIICNALDQMADTEKVLKETARVLKDDGILIVPTYVGGKGNRGLFYKEASLMKRDIVYHNWTPESFMNYLEDRGWVITEQRVVAASVPFMYCECRRKNTAPAADDTAVNTSDEELYLPLKAKIDVSRKMPQILLDRAVLNIEDRLPEIAKNMPEISEYSMLCHAVLSANAEKYIRMYLNRYPDCMVVNAKAGLETFSLRCRQEDTIFYEMDEPAKLKIRSIYFPSSWFDRYLPYHFLDDRWIREVKKEAKRTLLINACGAFTDCTREQVLRFLTIVSEYGEAYVLFDADSSENGGILVQRANLRDKKMPTFTVDDIRRFAAKAECECTVEETSLFFEGYDRGGLRPDTRFKIRLVTKMALRRMYVLKVSGKKE